MFPVYTGRLWLYVSLCVQVAVCVPVCLRCVWLPRLSALLVPQDSYLLDYFLSLNRYFEVGAPVYFVTTSGYNFSSEAGMNGICSSAGCDSFSLTQKIQYATEFPNQ